MMARSARKDDNGFYAREYVLARMLARGKQYLAYLFVVTMWWGGVAMVVCALFVALRGVLGNEVPGDRVLRALALSLTAGVLLRLMLESAPKEILIDNWELVLHHTSWSVYRYPISSIVGVKLTYVSSTIARLDITVAGHLRKPVVIGLSHDKAQELLSTLQTLKAA
jgi:hypothetical protein